MGGGLQTAQEIWGTRKCSKLGDDDGCTILFAESHCVIHLKWVKFIVCKSYLNKVVFRNEIPEEGPAKPHPQDGRAHCMQRKESCPPDAGPALEQRHSPARDWPGRWRRGEGLGEPVRLGLTMGWPHPQQHPRGLCCVSCPALTAASGFAKRHSADSCSQNPLLGQESRLSCLVSLTPVWKLPLHGHLGDLLLLCRDGTRGFPA